MRRRLLSSVVESSPESVEVSAPALIARPARAVAPSTFLFREKVAYRRARRAIDILGALTFLCAAAPILVLAAIVILIDDGWPIFFCQRRVGRFGRLFTMYKLRTMRKEKCVDGFSPTSGADTRITRAGYWLRKTSIDELPQLINILRGEMAFVGPRPEMPFVVREYAAWQHLRHLVTPGMTGFWQTTYRSTIPLHLPEATLLDLDYVRAASHYTDAKVVLKTIWCLISTQGAY
jgi:lipopolysaccharide/colanic/teichoic acid biosynthesis glycosyltransferase